MGSLERQSNGSGKLLGGYRLLEVVGEGSFGKVWKARKVGALRTVAIKLIPKAGKKEKDVKGLRQEIDILRTLRHANIIQMLDAFETGSDFCVVTEFAQGELFEIVESDTNLSEDVVQTIAKQLVDALHYLHSNRIIHRDMKPQNILLAADGTVKLCDFGFARAMSHNTFVLTSIKGTPLYMAPELVQERPYTHAVDVWSLGVILYELFVGKPPFYTTSIYSLIKKIVNHPPTYPSNMSSSFKSFLKGVLEKDPNKRLDWPALLEHPFIRGPGERANNHSVDTAQKDKKVEEIPASRSRTPPQRIQPNDEPVFVDPPQFSPQGSPGDGPMGSALSERLPSGSLPQQRTPILPILVDADRKVNKGMGTHELASILTNPSTLEAIRGALDPPSGGLGLTKWSKLQESQYVVKLLDNVLSKLPHDMLLQEMDPSGQLTSMLVLLAKSAHVCVGANPQFAAKASAALTRCTDWIISLETVSLCCELVSTRGSWSVVIDGCLGIQSWALKAQCTLLDRSSKFKVMAEKVIDRLLKKKIPGRICRSIEDYARNPHTIDDGTLVLVALKALAALLPAAHHTSTCTKDSHTFVSNWMESLRDEESSHESKSSMNGSVSNLMLWCMTAQYIYESAETQKALIRCIRESEDAPMDVLLPMIVRLIRLEPRIARTMMLNKIPETVIHHSSCIRPESASLVVTEILQGISSSSSATDVAFLEKKCSAIVFKAMKSEWIPQISSGGVDVKRSCTMFGAIGSFMLLFHKHWPRGGTFSHMNAIKSLYPSMIESCEAVTSNNVYLALDDLEGVPSTTGLLDGLFRLLYCISIFDIKQAINEGLIDTTVAFMVHLSCGSDAALQSISPDGILSCLKIVHLAVEKDARVMQHLCDKKDLIHALISIISPSNLDRIKKFYIWSGSTERSVIESVCSGQSSGSMAECINSFRITVLRILQAPWTQAALTGKNLEDIFQSIKECIHLESNLIPYIVGIVDSVKMSDPGGAILLQSCSSMLARLALLYGDEAVVVFARSGGLEASVMETLLSMENPDAMLVSSLLVISQLARTATSKNQIQKFIDSGIMKLLPDLLRHPSSAGVRARACNLLGNLCRYSDDVYPMIRDSNILPPLIALCEDEDKDTRKFACFAIGNAGFHNNYLYKDLTPAVKVLINLLGDGEDRTRANASGALGNLVRNSSELVPEMLRFGAIEALVRIIEEGMQSKGQQASTAFQIALFSLGNLAAHKECHETFQELHIADLMLEIEDSKNATAAKYANRVLTKMSTRGRKTVQQTPLKEH